MGLRAASIQKAAMVIEESDQVHDGDTLGSKYITDYTQQC